MRVLLTGMGGQLGTNVARLLEARDDVESIIGFDLDPPRRHLQRAVFHRIDPRSARRVGEVVREAAPTVVVHLGVYEPHARFAPAQAGSASVIGAGSLAHALARCEDVEHIVVRSGIEVYGRRRGGPMRPDEDTVPAPTCDFGKSLLDVENRLAGAGEAASVPVTLLRMAPIVGSHVPNPLGRILKLSMVPINALSDPAFELLHADDAAAAIIAAIDRRPDSPVNVVGPGAVTASQAARSGKRMVLPIFGPAWRIAQLGTELVSAPLPDHVVELLIRGRVADGGRADALLGFAPTRSTREIIAELYEQANVYFLPVDARIAA